MPAAASTRPLTGRKVLIMLVAFFAVVLSANAVMMKLAIDTLPGTDVDSAYKASLAYSADMQAARDQAARRWSVVGHVERNGDGRTAVRVAARDAADGPLTGLTVSVRLSHPAAKRGDLAVGLGEREAGLYAAQISNVAPGQWDLIIETYRGTERLFLSRNRVVLP